MTTFNAKATGGIITLTTGNDTVNLGKGKDVIRTGLSHGTNNIINNYDSKNDIFEIAKGIKIVDGVRGYSMVGNDLVLRLGKTKMVVKNMVNKAINFRVQGSSKVETSNFYKELPKNSSYAKKGSTYDWTKVVANGNFSGTFKMDEYNENLKTFDARSVKHSVNINGSSRNDVIYAGNYGGVIQAKNGNDIINLGKGADVIRVDTADGNDVVNGYDSSKDIFEIAKGTKMYDGVRGYSMVGNDLVLRLGSTQMTVKNMVNKGVRFRVEGSKKVEVANFYKELPKNSSYAKKGSTYDWTKVVANGNFSGTFKMDEYNENLKTFDARSVKRSVNINGTSRNDVIYAGNYGGVIQGKNGNDTIYLGKGSDVIRVDTADGNDVVNGYDSSKDIFEIAKGTKMYDGVRGYSMVGNDLVLRLGSTQMTVKNMVNKGVRFRVEGSKKVEVANFYKEQPKNTSFAKKGSTYDWTKVVANGSFSGKYDMSDYNENLKTFDGKATSKKIMVKGRNKTANVVYTGKGGSEVYTRTGNDTIYCGSGADLLWFGKGDGKDTIVNSGKNDVAYLYGVKDIKQVTAKLTKGVMTLGVKGASDTFNISGWKAGNSLSTVQLANGAKYSFAANGKFTKK